MSEIPDNKDTRYQFEVDLGYYLTFGNYLKSYKDAFEALMYSVYQSEY